MKKVIEAYVRDDDGTLQKTKFIVGASAYDQYRLAGGTKTEEEFCKDLEDMETKASVDAKIDEVKSEFDGEIEEVNNKLLEYDGFINEYSGLVDITKEYEYTNGYFAYWNGVLSVGESDMYEHVIIDCSDKKDLIVTSNGNKNSRTGIFFKDKPFDKTTFIGHADIEYSEDVTSVTSLRDYTLTIPSEAKYVVINNRKPNGLLQIMKKESRYIANKVIELSNTNDYRGKNILLLGDSITQLGMGDRGWVRYFSERVKPSRVDNLAVIGARFCDDNDTTIYNGNPQWVSGDEQNVVGNQIQKIINNRSDYLTDYDYVFICAGTNDNENSRGTMSYSEVRASYFNADGSVIDVNTIKRNNWAGASRYHVEKLRDLFPTATIVINTPINRMDGLTSFERIYNANEMLRKASLMVSVPLCDTTRCGISMNDVGNFNNDGLHPSIKGAKLLGNYVADWLINYEKSKG